jgi:energy-coupling factor transporter ATP-binding protein EcfA2
MTMAFLKINQIKLSATRGINYFSHPDAATYGADVNFQQMPKADTAGINVFAGPNGAGKTTFLDAVRALAKTDLLLTLRRNRLSYNEAYHSFRLLLSDETVIDVQFEETGKIALKYLKHERILDDAYPQAHDGVWGEGEKKRADSFFIRRGLHVEFWPGPSQAKFDTGFFKELNLLQPYLTGIDSILQSTDAKAVVTFIDEPWQMHCIASSELPAGWKAAAGLLSWTSRLPKGSLCVVEEPETHLHPVLQRRLAARLTALARERKLQVFLSTHSAVFLNPATWQANYADFAVFHVDGRNVVRVDNADAQHGTLLDELGTKVSDLLQSNCVVWVEGPSDRIYIRYWLKKWCAFHKLNQPIENVHYVFSFYGGSVLSHFDAAPQSEIDDAVSMLKLNRKSLVVMDRDNDFKWCGACGSTIRTKLSCAKYKVIDDLPERVWVTEGYTIESYLPQAYFDKQYLIQSGVDRVEIGTKLSKVKLARKYEQDHENASFPDLFGAIKPTRAISRLYDFIRDANHEL